MRFVFAFAWLVVLSPAWVRGAVIDDVAADPPATGALVVRPAAGGPAERAGLRPGDVVTHYAGKAVASSKELVDAVAANANAGDELELVYVRRGSPPATVRVPPGKIGLATLPIEQGKPRPLRPPATDVSFDFTAYKTTPRDEWYALRTPDGKHVGFQHHRVEVKDDRLVATSEYAFEGRDRPRHLIVTMTATTDAKPRLIETRHEGPLEEGFLCTLKPDADGRRLAVRLTENGKTSERTVELTADAMYEYLAIQLAAAMPLRPGTCLHYDVITEQGDVTDPAALHVGEPGQVDVDGKPVAAVPVTTYRLGQKIRTTWVDPATRTILRFDSPDGGTAVRTTREQAVTGVNPQLKPRT